MFNTRKPEILAPAGSFESLYAAIAAGADAIYFGVEQLNMRARSSNNFTLDNIAEVVSCCREKNVKAYLTLNTVVFDHDLALVRSILQRAAEAGVAGVIASDHAVMAFATKMKIPIHISTQANVSNIETVEFYSAFADVVVLARELTLQQVAAIVREIERRQITGPTGELMRIEIFAHGALCMAVSGKCYMSLHSHYASANRGACIQNCRRQYIVTDKEEGIEFEIDNQYIMSAKDLCTIDFLDKIVSTGVRILKIEGRGRAADYVHTTTSCYREAVDAISNGTYHETNVAQWMKRLATVYNRGFWDGYYLGRKMGEWSDSHGSKATERKLFLGKAVRFFPRLGVGEFLMETHSLKVGDEIMVTGTQTGYIRSVVSGIRVDDHPVDVVSKGTAFSIKLDLPVRKDDKLYKVVKD